MHYLIALRLNQSLQRVLVDEETGCWILNDGIEVIAFDYQALSWKKTHRVIGIRQKIDERPDTQGKTLSLLMLRRPPKKAYHFGHEKRKT